MVCSLTIIRNKCHTEGAKCWVVKRGSRLYNTYTYTHIHIHKPLYFKLTTFKAVNQRNLFKCCSWQLKNNWEFERTAPSSIQQKTFPYFVYYQLVPVVATAHHFTLKIKNPNKHATTYHSPWLSVFPFRKTDSKYAIFFYQLLQHRLARSSLSLFNIITLKQRTELHGWRLGFDSRRG